MDYDNVVRVLVFLSVVNPGISIGISECGNSFQIKSSTTTVTRGTLVFTTKENLNNWVVQISLDRGVKNLKVGKSGFSVKSGDKKTFTVKPLGKNKKLLAGQTLELPLTISYAK